MTASVIVLTGAKGGQGTTTMAAALALLTSTQHPTTLVATDAAAAAAALGVLPPDGTDTTTAVTAELELALPRHPTGERAVVVDAGAATAAPPDAPLSAGLAAPELRRYLVLRGPCYLALSAVLAAPSARCDGVILVAEEGRTLRAGDVTDVLDVPVVATVPVTPRLARTVDAGLLPARYHRLTELAQLRPLAASLATVPTPTNPSSTPTAITCTDLPLSQCDNGEAGWPCRDRMVTTHVSGVWRKPARVSGVEHRASRARRGRLLLRGSRHLR